MKIFHTADWHLGKLVQGVYMTEDQHFILEQFIAAIDQEQPDVIIIAGDLYDRAIPPVDAVDLLDDILSKISLQRKIPVLAIAGNHDSPTRLQFGRQLMQRAGLHIVGDFSELQQPVVLNDGHGEVHFHLIPFAEPATVKTVLQDETILTYDDAMRKTIEHIVSNLDTNARHIAIAHAFVTPNGDKQDNTSDSERPLAIGGSECVNAHYFEPFHYTALGHLHRAHYVLNETIRYAGSPLKYSASEASHEKGFLVIDLMADGKVTVTKRPFIPRRDLRMVEGTLQEILQHKESEDYVFIRLTDTTPVIGAMEQLRTVYKNALHVERKTIFVERDEERVIMRDQLDERTLFQGFMKEMTGEEPSQHALQLFDEALQELLMEEREEETVK
ncbi:exonuclease SbcCD subunit D [Metasolibacillus meyeri]|uniref:exonuclease SbcCD subunit D n=1 Tax=Metasolibacillus meyeri TaxID=1071052 RepID=UPI000D303DDA|nr:exonuclease SbcCD subunit D [Metasolibacillus meyeri]